MVLEAGYVGTTGFRKVVKATVLVKKKDGISDAAFIEHYNNKHAQAAAPVLLKHKIISYSLVGPHFHTHTP
jgi:EthD domain